MSTSEKKKTRRKFTPEFKLQAVKRVLAGHPVAAVARELGIGESLLHNWVTRHRLTEGGGALQVEQAAEIARLKRALAHKEEEAAILKNHSPGAPGLAWTETRVDTRLSRLSGQRPLAYW